MQATECIWRQLLPDCVEVSAGSGQLPAAPLKRLEEAATPPMGRNRKAEFSIGRSYARAALRKIGVNDVDLPVRHDRAPIWPLGVTGSITHAADNQQSYFAVAVTGSSSLKAIGIDAEFISSVKPNIWRQFLNSRELEFVRRSPIDDRARLAAVIWCAKEAATKAVGRLAEPCLIEVLPRQKLDGLVQLWSVKFPDVGKASVHARTACLNGVAFAAVVVTSSSGRS